MERTLSQEEIDSLIEALNTIKDYGGINAISEDILQDQIVLTQPEIDALIISLENTHGKEIISEADPRVVLSQPEIDKLIVALQNIRPYDDSHEMATEIANDQVVLSQDEIDKLIEMLRKMEK